MAEAGGSLWEFEVGLIDRTSSRTVRATERNLVLKNEKQNKTSQSFCIAHDFCYSLGGVSLEGSYIKKVGSQHGSSGRWYGTFEGPAGRFLHHWGSGPLSWALLSDLRTFWLHLGVCKWMTLRIAVLCFVWTTFIVSALQDLTIVLAQPIRSKYHHHKQGYNITQAMSHKHISISKS